MAEKKIMTVCGSIEPDKLGLTSMHDHIMFDGSFMRRQFMSKGINHAFPIHENDKVSLENVGILHRNTLLAWDALKQDDEKALTEELALFKRAGGSAILELSVPGVRLDPAAIQRISEKTDVYVIVSTGFYSADSWPQGLHGQSVDHYVSYMMREIEEGVAGTKIKPGHLKIALQYLNADEEKALRAAARVGAETGMSLTVHPCRQAGGAGHRILDIVEEEGLMPERVVMAHAVFTDKPNFAHAIKHPEDFRVNIAPMRELLDRGANISKEFLNPMAMELNGDYDDGDWSEMSGLVKLIGEGYAGQIVLGNDCRAKIALHQFGGEGYCRMLYYTLPMLRNVAGLADYALRQMTIDNPARILAF
ncbi:MAG: phosphotriesterase [Clostridiales bacterium]|nr:phosphotriesterase [Clostridiales bacterium]